MTKIGNVLLFEEPEDCEEIPYPARREHVSDAEAERIEHDNRWTANTCPERHGWTVA